MKKITLFLFLLIGLQIQAQQILNIYSVPANPTTADSVYILADCQFNSGGCSVWQQGHSFTSSFNIDAYAMHCLGPLAVICNYTDTFQLGVLAAGNYTFSFYLDNGFGGPPCTPGIVPGPTDTFTFTVSVPTAVEEIEKEEFNIYPNPANKELKIQNSELRIETIELYNALGKKMVCQQPTANGQQQIVLDVSDFSEGIYFLQLKTENKFFGKRFAVQR